ncbi:MAG: lysophospholipid acyltransferase family protein [Dehalococcoidales bacterium]|nr:lysophospholipid acyltransferase family protein [Dehalococcoidales bacterium]
MLFFTARWQVKGRENIPGQGPLLVVANHLGLVDPPLLAVSLNRKAIFMAKQELFHSRFSSYFVSGFGAFPVQRGQPDRKALRHAERVLAEGFALVMFPEASRSRNGELQPALPGSVRIALRSGATILPAAITGTEQIKGMGWLLRRPRLTVNFGVPFQLPPRDGKLSREELAECTSYMMQRIAQLLPPEYRGYYADEEGRNGT